MDTMQLITYLLLLLTLIVTLIPEIASRATYYDVDRIVQSPVGSIDRLDDDFYITYPQQKRQPVRRSDSSLSNLNNGYYYIDNGSITPVKPNGSRRQDLNINDIDANNLPDNVRFTPLVRFKQTKTNRKKLFVPNFFG